MSCSISLQSSISTDSSPCTKSSVSLGGLGYSPTKTLGPPALSTCATFTPTKKKCHNNLNHRTLCHVDTPFKPFSPFPTSRKFSILASPTDNLLSPCSKKLSAHRLKHTVLHNKPSRGVFASSVQSRLRPVNCQKTSMTLRVPTVSTVSKVSKASSSLLHGPICIGSFGGAHTVAGVRKVGSARSMNSTSAITSAHTVTGACGNNPQNSYSLTDTPTKSTTNSAQKLHSISLNCSPIPLKRAKVYNCSERSKELGSIYE